jgi:hypothetical protein
MREERSARLRSMRALCGRHGQWDVTGLHALRGARQPDEAGAALHWPSLKGNGIYFFLTDPGVVGFFTFCLLPFLGALLLVLADAFLLGRCVLGFLAKDGREIRGRRETTRSSSMT